MGFERGLDARQSERNIPTFHEKWVCLKGFRNSFARGRIVLLRGGKPFTKRVRVLEKWLTFCEEGESNLLRTFCEKVFDSREEGTTRFREGLTFCTREKLSRERGYLLRAGETISQREAVFCKRWLISRERGAREKKRLNSNVKDQK